MTTVSPLGTQMALPAPLQLLMLQLMTSALQNSGNETDEIRQKKMELGEWLNLQELSSQHELISSLERDLTQSREKNEVLRNLNEDLQTKLVNIVQLHGNLTMKNQRLQDRLDNLTSMNKELHGQMFAILSRNQDTQKRMLALENRNQELQGKVVENEAVFRSMAQQLQIKLIEKDVELADFNRNLSLHVLNLTKRVMDVSEDERKCQATLNIIYRAVDNISYVDNNKHIRFSMGDAQNKVITLEKQFQKREILERKLRREEEELRALKSNAELLTLQPELAQEILLMNTTSRERRLLDGVASGNVPTVRLLLLFGTNPAVREGGYADGMPLHRAAGKGNVRIAQELLYAGALVDARDKFGDTPLHWAAEGGQLDMCRLLLEHGAQVDAMTSYMNTPLHLAAASGQLAVVQLLAQHGADLNALNHMKHTPREEASKNGRKDVYNWIPG